MTLIACRLMRGCRDGVIRGHTDCAVTLVGNASERPKGIRSDVNGGGAVRPDARDAAGKDSCWRALAFALPTVILRKSSNVTRGTLPRQTVRNLSANHDARTACFFQPAIHEASAGGLASLFAVGLFVARHFGASCPSHSDRSPPTWTWHFCDRQHCADCARRYSAESCREAQYRPGLRSRGPRPTNQLPRSTFHFWNRAALAVRPDSGGFRGAIADLVELAVHSLSAFTISFYSHPKIIHMSIHSKNHSATPIACVIAPALDGRSPTHPSMKTTNRIIERSMELMRQEEYRAAAGLLAPPVTIRKSAICSVFA